MTAPVPFVRPLLADQAARDAIASALDDTLVVEASAGTGKTTELVVRIVRVLASGRARITEIVAVTFTEKAAGELKLRLREALERDRGAADNRDVRARLDEALERLEEAHVNTIHGFCAELLRERPVEAGVDPLFTVLTEAQADRVYDRAFDAWLQDALQQPSDALRRALRRTSAGPSGAGPVDRVRAAGRDVMAWRQFPAPWRRPPFDRDRLLDETLAAVHRLAEVSSAPDSSRDPLYLSLDAARRLSRQVLLERSFGERDADGWEARLVDLERDKGLRWPKKGRGVKYGPRATRSDVLGALDAVTAALRTFKRAADADLAAGLQADLVAATARYEASKHAAGALDFADLLQRALAMVRDNAAVRRHLQEKYTRIFIDEFQDTDPVQAEILWLLAADDPECGSWTDARPVPGKLFIVGDPKQSIYRFRGADVGTYWHVVQRVREAGGQVLTLTTSFRSRPDIQRFVNAAFSTEMIASGDTLQAAYEPLTGFRGEDTSQPAIVALPVPKPYGRSFRPTRGAIDASLPDAIGAYVAWLVDPAHGWQVAERQRDGAETLVQVQPRHIAILFRRFVSFGEDVTRAYTDALEARGIQHLLVGGKTFHGREEVETIRAALAAVEWPDDELSVFAALRGALFAIDDETLLEFRHRFGHFHPFRIPRELGGNSGSELALTADPTAHLVPIADALRVLQHLHRGRNYRPVADTLGRLMAETRAHVGFVLRPAGEQVLANVLHVAELARQYEAAGGISFRGFIEELQRASESAGTEAPILEESSDGVKLMTVHKAKGLEFPVVILADLTCSISRDDPGRFLDTARGLCALRIGGWVPHDLHEHEAEESARDRAEGVRLAYVAATRARDLLVVPAVGDEPWDGGWCSPLNSALYPPMETRRTAVRAPRCPAFPSKDSVLERPDDEPARPSTVCPGLHALGRGAAGADATPGYDVVWWEPGPGGGLTLGAKAPFGVRREELIVKDVPKRTVADGDARYRAWTARRAAVRERAAMPSLVLDTVQSWSADLARPLPPGVDPSAVAVIQLDVPASSGSTSDARPRGASFGALVHALLARTPLDGQRDLVERIAAAEVRLLGLGRDEQEAAVHLVVTALAHPLFDRVRRAAARSPRAVRREVPITYRSDDGSLLEGVVDLAFEERDQWVVIDYKTDRELAASGEIRYRRQVALYAEAIAQATARPAQAILVRL